MSEYYHTSESVKEYIELAKDVSGADLIEELKQVSPQGSKLLELGSGPGTDYNILKEHFKVVGSDYSLEFIKYLKSKYHGADFLYLNAATLDIQETFDGIYSNKVLHHLSDDQLKSSIQGQHEILNFDGIICHSFWKGEGDETFKGMYVNYHNEDDLKQYFGDRFNIIYLKPYKEFEDGDSLLLIGRKK
jgi:cyclopropane fatty-acyl-phospholipid synthase-like methyltransferase